MCLLRPLSEIEKDAEKVTGGTKNVAMEKSVGEIVVSTFDLMKNPKMLMLTPLFFTGISFGFLCSDFSKDLVHESLGVQHIGLVMCAFGGADAIACLLLGKLSAYISQYRLIILMYLGYTSIFCFFLFWSVRTNAYFELYLVVVIYGFADAIAITQIYALIGETFQDNMESAFPCFECGTASPCRSLFLEAQYFLGGLKFFS